MDISDFFDYKSKITYKKTKGILKICDIQVMKVMKGSYSLFAKKEYEDLNFQELPLLDDTIPDSEPTRHCAEGHHARTQESDLEVGEWPLKRYPKK